MDEDDADNRLAFGTDTPITRLLRETATQRFNSKNYTDLVIRCGPRVRQDFHCHKFLVLRQFPNLGETYGMYRDESLGCDVIKIGNKTHEVVIAMLVFIYTGNYHHPADCDWVCTECDIAYFHALVHDFAASHDFRELEELSKAKFTSYLDHHLSLEAFLKEPDDLVVQLYEQSVTGRDLKDILLAFCARHAMAIMGNPKFYYDYDFPDDFWKELACYFAGRREIPKNPFD